MIIAIRNNIFLFVFFMPFELLITFNSPQIYRENFNNFLANCHENVMILLRILKMY